jgi:cephalosporin hydroxylase
MSEGADPRDAGTPDGRAEDALTTFGVAEAFTRLWYEREQRRTWRETTWLGVPAQQCPLDAWVYQEIIWETRPEIVIEVGVKSGGMTLFLATLLQATGAGRVIGIDRSLRAHESARTHPVITLIEADALDPSLHANLAEETAGRRALVLLDSDHTSAHVLQELELYSGYVQPGDYIIVNDTAINGHPVLPGWGDGPYEAVQQFLAADHPFEADRSREKHMVTMCPMGFLRRVALDVGSSTKDTIRTPMAEANLSDKTERSGPGYRHGVAHTVRATLARLGGPSGNVVGEPPSSEPAASSLVISFPKSGRTWLSYLYVFYAAHRLLSPGEAEAFVKRYLSDGFSYNPHAEAPFGELLVRPANEPVRVPAIRFVHGFPTSGDVPYFQATVKLKKLAQPERALFLVRDPRDIIVSYFHHAMTKGKVPLASDVDISEFARSECLGIRAIVTYMNQVCEQAPGMFTHFDTLYFEDLVADTRAAFTAALTALGVEDVRPEAVEAAVHSADFKKLQGADRNKRVARGKGGDEEALRFRRGEVGSFCDELQPDDIEFVNGVIERRLTADLSRYRSGSGSDGAGPKASG